MSDDPEDLARAERLKQLEAKIAKAKGAEAKETPHTGVDYSQGELAWRMVIEMTAGILIGFGIGYGLDALFGTMPIFLVLFTMFGLAAGIQTMMRTAKEVEADRKAAEEEDG